jgi:hypothetical protein
MNFRLPLAALCAGALLLTAGCSSDAKKPAAAPSPPALRCDKAPQATVSSTLGVDVSPVTETDQVPVTVCTYQLTAGNGVVLLRFQSVVDAGRFAEIRKGFTGNTADVAGFQDEAFTSTSGTGPAALNSVGARKGDVAIVISAPAPLDKEKALVTQLFSSL